MITNKKWWVDNRQSVIDTVYQALLLDSDVLKIEQELIDNNKDEDFIKIIKAIINDKAMIINTIVTVITNDWTFNRLHILSQAVLICGAYEILILKKPKAIIINSYVEILKSISDPKTTKLINALLDKI